MLIRLVLLTQLLDFTTLYFNFLAFNTAHVEANAIPFAVLKLFGPLGLFIAKLLLVMLLAMIHFEVPDKGKYILGSFAILAGLFGAITNINTYIRV